MDARRSRGFSLVELLVVIAIIGVLAALLFAVFARSRDNGRRASCLSNERQVGMAFLQYEQESDERYPNGTVERIFPEMPPAPPTKSPPDGEGWAGQVYSYVKNVGVFQCPDDPTLAAPPTQRVSFGYNNWLLAPADVSAVPGRVLSTPKTVLLFETTGNTAQITQIDEGAAQGARQFSAAGDGGLLISAPGGSTGSARYATGWMGPYDPTKDGSGQYPERSGRHAGGADFLMTDGHVKWLLPERVLSAMHPKLSDAEFDGYDAWFENQNYRKK